MQENNQRRICTEMKLVYKATHGANLEGSIKQLAFDYPTVEVSVDSVETRKRKLGGLVPGKSDYFITINGEKSEVYHFFKVLSDAVKTYNRVA